MPTPEQHPVSSLSRPPRLRVAAPGFIDQERMRNACTPYTVRAMSEPVSLTKNVQVRDVPVTVVAALTRLAEDEGLSLNLFLKRRLVELASTPTVGDILKRLEPYRSGFPDRKMVAPTLRESRDDIDDRDSRGPVADEAGQDN